MTLFASNLSGCATVPVPNERVCADKGARGATCSYTNSSTTTKLTKAEWDKLRFGWACMSVPSLTALIGVIKKLCFDSGRCTYEELEDFNTNMNRIYEDLQVKR